MTQRMRSTILAVALLGAPGLAMAEVSRADRDFIEKAAMGGHEEVAAGETAAKSENSAVAAFGRQMVTDHTRMNDELATIAQGLGVTPPDSPSLMQQAKGAATSVLPGGTFDRTYVDQQLSDHQATLGLLKGEAAGGADPALKAFAAKYVPVVEQHIAELEKLKQQVAKD